MVDHVRKFDDWDIHRPTKPVSSVAQTQGDVEPVDDQMAQEPQSQSPATPVPEPENNIGLDESNLADTVANPPEGTTTAPVDFSNNAGEEIVNPFAETQDSADPATSADADRSSANGTMIDPDTGLPVPDYMKPFLGGKD